MSGRPPPPESFEPPRAGLLGGVWRAWYAFRRRFRLQVPEVRVRLKPVHATVDWGWVVLVPTYAWFALDRRRLGRFAAGVYAVSAVTAFLGLGWQVAGLAAGVMIALHGLGIADYFYSGKILPQPRYWLLRSAGVILVVGIVYSIASPRLLATFVVPMQTDRGAVLINTRTRLESLVRGEMIAFRGMRWFSGNLVLIEGAYFGRVLGLPGDVIGFGESTFTVNGRSQPRPKGMPRRGEIRVPAGHLFVWPHEILAREFALHDQAVSFAQSVALLPESRFFGRPYDWWFFRRQDHVPK
jgi:signal peptidase I